jgi:hypothetical protein
MKSMAPFFVCLSRMPLTGRFNANHYAMCKAFCQNSENGACAMPLAIAATTLLQRRSSALATGTAGQIEKPTKSYEEAWLYFL